MEYLLDLQGIGKTFPGVIALQDINFQLKAGEVHAVCGENGAGKSTLMKVITGAHKPDAGSICVEGCECNFQKPTDAFGYGIAIIYQETSLFEEMTVLENLFLGREPMKKVGPLSIIDYTEMEKKAGKIFEELGVDIPLNRKIKECGMAEKQMIEIAKALTFNAKILILDEPTASLVQREVENLFSIINRLKKSGVGVVYISHRLEEIFILCDRVTVIRDGCYISTKNVSETNKDELVADMVGRNMDNYYPKQQVEIGETILTVKNFTDGNLLGNINFELKKGEVLGFAGLAGSGRTELALALCKLEPSGNGEIVLDGKSLNIKNYRDAMSNGIVYVSEDRGKYGVVLEMSVHKNIVMSQIDQLANFGFINLPKEREIAENMRKHVGIKAPNIDFMVANLSGGNQQKVAVSEALALNPKVLILDEPTRGVDVGAKAEIHSIISQMVKEGLSIIMISSELPELLGMCDRIHVMRNGELAGVFDATKTTQEAILRVALAEDQEVAGA